MPIIVPTYPLPPPPPQSYLITLSQVVPMSMISPSRSGSVSSASSSVSSALDNMAHLRHAHDPIPGTVPNVSPSPPAPTTSSPYYSSATQVASPAFATTPFAPRPTYVYAYAPYDESRPLPYTGAPPRQFPAEFDNSARASAVESDERSTSCLSTYSTSTRNRLSIPDLCANETITKPSKWKVSNVDIDNMVNIFLGHHRRSSSLSKSRMLILRF